MRKTSLLKSGARTFQAEETPSAKAEAGDALECSGNERRPDGSAGQ